MKTVSTFRNRSTNFVRTLFLALVAVIALSASAGAIQITIDMGRASRDCRGFGICKITIDLLNSQNQTLGDARLNGNQLTLSFAQPVGQGEQTLPIDQPIELDPQTARALGAARLVVLPGTYEIDYSSNPNGEVTLPVERVGITIEIDPGRKSKDCTGFGICSITITIELLQHPTSTVGTVDGNVLTLDLMEPTPERGDVMIIDEDIPLDSATTRALGIEPRVVKSGAYPVDYSSNPNGTVHLQTGSPSTNAIGLSLNVKLGRRSQGCRGFGICQIWIGTDAAGEAAQARGELNGDKLRIDFQSKLDEQGTALVIDEPIELDGATSLALGRHRVVVLPGSYPVDYSSNPNGSVEVRVQSIGVTIGVDVGRPKKNCTGFGICKVWIEFDLRMGTAPTVAWLQDSTLTLLFTSELSETGEEFTIDDDIELERAAARLLGAKHVTIKKGSYPIRHDAEGHPYVELPVNRIGITVTIDVGRKSRDCKGFGVCSITIGVDFSERSVQGTATVENGILELDFLGESPERDDIFAIDENIALDQATAKALGVSEVLPGAYQIDYATNEHGTARVVVAGSVASVAATSTSGTAKAEAMPNPTAGTTVINFNVRQRGSVLVELTDARGNHVAQLLNGNVEAGEHQVSFDAGTLPAGVYFFTVRSATGTESGRMIVTR